MRTHDDVMLQENASRGRDFGAQTVRVHAQTTDVFFWS